MRIPPSTYAHARAARPGDQGGDDREGGGDAQSRHQVRHRGGEGEVAEGLRTGGGGCAQQVAMDRSRLSEAAHHVDEHRDERRDRRDRLPAELTRGAEHRVQQRGEGDDRNHRQRRDERSEHPVDRAHSGREAGEQHGQDRAGDQPDGGVGGGDDHVVGDDLPPRDELDGDRHGARQHARGGAEHVDPEGPEHRADHADRDRCDDAQPRRQGPFAWRAGHGCGAGELVRGGHRSFALSTRVP